MRSRSCFERFGYDSFDALTVTVADLGDETYHFQYGTLSLDSFQRRISFNYLYRLSIRFGFDAPMVDLIVIGR